MPITALPAHTVRALGSSQALTEPSSLVKELLDNAIDSQATSIYVEVAANSLSDIRVKDNGHGIHPDDRAMVCQRHCTSKIRDLDELRTLGGRSLGFRGIALASAAELSGCLTISTRVEGEETASEMKFNRQGQLASEKRISLPVGTTVRIEKFLETLPIRRKAAEKGESKTLAKIRRMLQAYAIANPHLRISTKVLKAKDEKSNWKYPITSRIDHTKRVSNISDAAGDIFGQKIIDECQYLQPTFSTEGVQINTISEDVSIDANPTFTFETVLPKVDCDPSIISNIGTYLSVDSRPVSCERGIFKAITSTFRSHLRCFTEARAEKKVFNPFLCMNIICPPGSYDVNVEPAKDDVLFCNADLVIRLVGLLFESVYGKLKSEAPTDAGNEKPPRSRGLDLMLARKKEAPQYENLAHRSPQREPLKLQSHGLLTKLRREVPPQTTSTTIPESNMPFTTQSTNETQGNEKDHIGETLRDIDLRTGNTQLPKLRPSMYDMEEDDCVHEIPISPAQSVSDDEVDEERDLKTIQVSNPWILAKLNAPRRPQVRKHQPCTEESSSDPSMGSSPPRPGLPTPAKSQHHGECSGFSPSTPFPFPLRARSKRKTDGVIEQSSHANPNHTDRGSLDAWVQAFDRNSHEHLDLSSNSERQDERSVSPADISAPGPFVSARTLPRGIPSSDIPDITQKTKQRAPPARQQQSSPVNSDIPAVRDLKKVWFDVGEKPKRKRSERAILKPRQQEPDCLFLREDDEPNIASPANSAPSSVQSDLALALEYESCKQLATQQHRDSLRQLVRQPMGSYRVPTIVTHNANKFTSSPHKNRQRAAIAALHTNPRSSDPPTDQPTVFAQDDPRAHLIRINQPSSTFPKNSGHRQPLKRTKTALLPLESIDSANYTGHLLQIVSTQTIDFDNLLCHSRSHDSYVRNGIIEDAFANSSAAHIPMWEAALKLLVKSQYRIEGMAADEEMDGELECDLSGILQRHIAEFT